MKRQTQTPPPEKRVLTYATVCSGIECMSVAAHGLPLRPVFFSEIEPFPCAVLKARYPDVPNLGDMGRIQVSNDGKEITNGTAKLLLDSRLDIFAGGTPCFAAGTMVLTPKGYVPIETLKVGDEVVTHRGRFRRILRVGSKEAETVSVHVVSRPPMRATFDHKFWSVTKMHHSHDNHMVIDGCGWRAVEKNLGGYVAQQRKYDIPMPADIPVNAVAANRFAPIEAYMEIAGWYCGDGCIRSYKSKRSRVVVLCLNAGKLALLMERIGEAFHVCQGKPDANGVFKVQICNTSLANWLERHFGRLAYGKTVPAWLIAAPQSFRDAFIRGYLATDGCILPNGTMSFTTVSKSLAYGVADILRDACVFYNGVSPHCEIQGREVNQRPFYIVRKNPKPNRFHAHEDWSFVRVKSLAARKTETVYQIEVEEDHSYVSNGVVSKNCQDVSVAGKRAGMAEGSGTRSSLAFEFVRLVRALRPRWVVWENVAGCLDSRNAPDFLRFAAAVGDCGYSVGWRVLDAQYVRVDGVERAVPQRRRRVWLVGRAGDAEREVAEVLFEPDRLVGADAPRRVTGQGFARPSDEGRRAYAGLVEKATGIDGYNQRTTGGVSRTIGAGAGNESSDTVPCVAVGSFDPFEPGGVKANSVADGVSVTLINGTCPGHHNGVVECYENDHLTPCEAARSLTGDHDDRVSDTGTSVVHAFAQNIRDEVRLVGGDGGVAGALAAEAGTHQQTYAVVSTNSNGGDVMPTLDGTLAKHQGDNQSMYNGAYVLSRAVGVNPAASGAMLDAVPAEELGLTLRKSPGGENGAIEVRAAAFLIRRLTPTECERLQGLPDGYTVPQGLPCGDPALVAEFQRIHDAFGAIMAAYAHRPAPKPKSAAWVRKWLAKITDPATCPDSPRYKVCGNGWAVNQPRWILVRILIREGVAW